MRGGGMQHKRLTAVALAVTVGGVGVGTAVGTPGTGIIGAPILARGTLDSDHHHHTGRWNKPLKIKLQRPSDVAVQQVTIAPGGSTGWHSHPGPAVVIVKSGSFTLYDGDDRRCTGETISVKPEDPVGKVFIDEGYGHVHIGRNEGSTNVELYVTYLDVPVGAAPRIDVPRPGNCPF
jgi:mannose-6-phosphate isomerase-like protein (cupin superfamily)